ncbi:MAG: TRAP transporter large permease subunit, partial [Pseudomonadota bacterium]
PSIVLILLGDVISNAYQESQLQQGIFAPETVSVGDLFAGALLPGLLLVGIYIVYLSGIALFRGNKSPAVPPEDRYRFYEGIRAALKTLPAPLLLIVAVLGAILTGKATPTEAASVGAVGGLLIAGSRSILAKGAALWLSRAGLMSIVFLLILSESFDMRLGRETVTGADELATVLAFGLCSILALGVIAALWSLVADKLFMPIMRKSAEVTTMVFTILIGAALFSLVFKGLGGEETIASALSNTPGGVTGAVIIVMLVMFVLGFFLDFIEIVLVAAPLVAPALLTLGVDPIWLGVMMAVNLQTSFLTPPFGFALFYLRGVAPSHVRTTQIYKGALPFVGIQIGMLCVLAFFPEIATWLPAQIYQ